MTVFQTRVDSRSEAFRARRAEMLGLVERLREYEARAEQLSEKRRERFAERAQLTPRERLTRLLDPGMPCVELYNLANFLVEDPNPATSVPGGNLITCIGFVSGVRCMILVDDSGINAGAVTPTTVPKALGAFDIALRHKLPLIHLVESAGANLLQYTVDTWAHGGGIYYRRALLSAAGIPTLSVLHGLSTAGGAYQPGSATTSSASAATAWRRSAAPRWSAPRPARSPTTASWARRRCTRRSPASSSTWPTTTHTAC